MYITISTIQVLSAVAATYGTADDDLGQQRVVAASSSQEGTEEAEPVVQGDARGVLRQHLPPGSYS